MGKSRQKKKKGGGVLGKALLNHHHRSLQNAQPDSQNVLSALGFESSTSKNTKSVTEHASPLDEFISNAVMAERSFEANRYASVVDIQPKSSISSATQDFRAQEVSFDFQNLPIPRRPRWDKSMSAAALDQSERESFLKWRREIAVLEEANYQTLRVTPFEKNIQFWRQLWRVVERSDVLVQVVDARNPLLYRCPDLEKYCKEVSTHKLNLLLVNKSDFMSGTLRRQYAEYFKKQGIRFAFFSAWQEQAKLDNPDEVVPAKDVGLEDNDESARRDGTSEILSREQVLAVLIRLAGEAFEHREERSGKPTIGMVGYPNVGKSSVINVLFGATSNDHSTKRVSVAATPGHTKHFQTLHLTDTAILCDCPGLVFPTFMNTKADLICNGILPIDNIKGRDFVAAIEIVCSCIPREELEATYSIKLDLPPSQTKATVDTLLQAFCISRGLQGGQHGRLNEAFGARLILKDFVSGKLVYVTPPPGFLPSNDVDSIEESIEATQLKRAKPKAPAEVQAEGGLTEERLLSESAVYEEDIRMKAQQTQKDPSRKLKKHGRKGRKGRDKDPYGGDDAFFGARTTGRQGDKFTRREAAWANR